MSRSAGFEIVGTALTDQRMTDGVEVKKSHHVKVVGNVVHDVGGCGICSIESNHVRIEGNEVYGASKWNTYQTSAISFFLSANIGGGNNGDGFSMYISGNRVHHNTNIAPPGAGQKVTDGNCIIVDYNDDNGYTGSTLIQNNLCYENGGRGVHVFHAKNVLAVNNTLVNNLRHPDIDGGELTASSASALVYRNNLTVASRPGAGVVVWSAQVQLDHNVYVGQAPGADGWRGSGHCGLGQCRLHAGREQPRDQRRQHRSWRRRPTSAASRATPGPMSGPSKRRRSAEQLTSRR